MSACASSTPPVSPETVGERLEGARPPLNPFRRAPALVAGARRAGERKAHSMALKYAASRLSFTISGNAASGFMVKR